MMTRSQVKYLISKLTRQYRYVAIFVVGNREPIWEIESDETIEYNAFTYEINAPNDEGVLVPYQMTKYLKGSDYDFFD